MRSFALRQQHAQARELGNKLSQSAQKWSGGDRTARQDVVAALRALVATYPSHIWNEEYVLFPLAGKLLSLQDVEELGQRFSQADAELGADALQRFTGLASRLAENVR
jgi:hemerythrin-like domain-containing protein